MKHLLSLIFLLVVLVIACVLLANFMVSVSKNNIHVGDMVTCGYNSPDIYGEVIYKHDGGLIISGYISLPPYEPRTGNAIPRLAKECEKVQGNHDFDRKIAEYKSFMYRDIGCDDVKAK